MMHIKLKVFLVLTLQLRNRQSCSCGCVCFLQKQSLNITHFVGFNEKTCYSYEENGYMSSIVRSDSSFFFSVVERIPNLIYKLYFSTTNVLMTNMVESLSIMFPCKTFQTNIRFQVCKSVYKSLWIKIIQWFSKSLA